MKALLAIETSTKEYSIAIGSDSVANIALTTTRFNRDFDGIAGLVEEGLAEAGMRSRDLVAIAVDTGPGNLTSVRAGVAYANALAYALDVPMFAADSLSVMAHSLQADSPVLASRPARGLANSEVYAGLFVDSEPMILTRGDCRLIAKDVARFLLEQGEKTLTVVGTHRNELMSLPIGLQVQDGGPAAATASSLYAMARSSEGRLEPGPVAPLTEESEVFR